MASINYDWESEKHPVAGLYKKNPHRFSFFYENLKDKYVFDVAGKNRKQSTQLQFLD